MAGNGSDGRSPYDDERRHSAGTGRIRRRGQNGGQGGAPPASPAPPRPAEPAQPREGGLEDLEQLLGVPRRTPSGSGGQTLHRGDTLAGLESLLEQDGGGADAGDTRRIEPPAREAHRPRQKPQRGADADATQSVPAKAADKATAKAEPKKEKKKKRRAKDGADEAYGSGEPPRKGFRAWLRRKITWKRVLAACGILLVFGIFFMGFFFVYTTRNDDLWLDLETIPYKTETVLYATDARSGEVTRFAVIPCTQNKEYVDPALMPQQLRDAFVAIEDRKFYTHHGFDFRRTVFAVANEVVYRVTGSYIGGDEGRKQGASTITQQLIKNLTRDDEGSNMAGYMRKLRELCRAIRLDALYTKDEILGAYLNTISFTGNTAGVQTEAKKLFGKTVEQLTLAECASLAAITNNPSRYNPYSNAENHLERRALVLYEMLDQGYITQAEHDAALAEPLNLTGAEEPRLPKYTTSYFTDTVISAVIDDFEEDYGLSRTEGSNLIYNGGLRIYTTVDPTLQRAMEDVMVNASYHPQPQATAYKQLSDEDGQPMVDEAGEPVMGDVQVTPQAAMISLDYEGGIRAVVGGLGEKKVSRGFNRATGAYRQVGSTMKPISPYVTALEDGWITWSTPFMDEPVMVMEGEDGEEIDWPANVDRVYSGREVLVREGLARSVNTTAVRVGRQSGNRRMYRFLKDDLEIGSLVRKDAAPGPLTLGSTTYGISPLDMAKAYAMFGNGGYTVTPHCYTTVESGTRSVMLTADTGTRRVISEETAFIMNKLLGEVMNNGTAAGMWVPGEMESSGKTGTTNDGRDHWFVGLTPYYVTASWYGYDENMPLEVAGGSGHPPTAAWRAVMQQAQAGLPAETFPECGTVDEHSYCTVSGSAAGPNCPAATGWYKWWQPPKGSCPVHGS